MNWAEFFAMGGYAVYVWGSYCVTLVIMMAEVLVLSNRGRTLAKRLNLTQKPETLNAHETET